MERLIMNDIKKWYNTNKKMCLLIDGARQVGKTYIVREFAKRYCKYFLEINLIDDADMRELLSNARNSNDVIKYLDTFYHDKLVPGKTLIFFDEVQECLNIVTVVKFLVDDGRFRYILSGSLLGTFMRDVRSVPVGYMQMMTMYPMNFTEFSMALGMPESSLSYLEECFDKVLPVDEAFHSRIMSNFRDYLLVGGMPAAVDIYLKTQSLAEIKSVHESICDAYRADISKYDKSKKNLITKIFDNIPDELNSQNKHFKYTSVDASRMNTNIENALLWLTTAGVAIPVYNVDSPELPLRASKTSSLLKLYMSDVGLLAYKYFDDNIQLKILADRPDVNFGGIYENYVAQELVSNRCPPYFFKNKNLGELDILAKIEGQAIPIEIKSGKDYKRHNALDNVLGSRNYGIEKAYVLSNYSKIERVDKKIYMPIYMAMFLKNRNENIILDIDKSPWPNPDHKEQ